MAGKKKKRITDMKELTKDFEKHMKGNAYKKNGKAAFEKTMDRIVKHKDKKKGDC